MQEQVKILNNLPDGAMIVESNMEKGMDLESPSEDKKNIKFLNNSLIKMFKDHVSRQEDIDKSNSSNIVNSSWFDNNQVNPKEFFDKIWMKKTNYEIENQSVKQNDQLDSQPWTFLDSISRFKSGYVYEIFLRNTMGLLVSVD